MAAPRSLTPRQEKAVVKARKRGDTYRAIATRFDVGTQTVYHIINPKARALHNKRNKLWARRVKPWQRTRKAARRKRA